MATALLEAGCAAFVAARLVAGTPGESSKPYLWFVWLLTTLVAYLFLSVWTASWVVRGDYQGNRRPRIFLWGAILPLLAIYSVWSILILFHPSIGGQPRAFLSPIEPFPAVSVAIALLAAFLWKAAITCYALPAQGETRARACAIFADLAIPVGLLVIGLLQASVFIIPVGNAFLRFWAIADAIGAGIPYPVTLTEPGPMSAGSPPYVYDLPLVPLMLRVAFTAFGHNTASAHLPAFVFNTLFPLSIYLLIRKATGSRTTAVVFATLASLFPYLRFWVLNLPDPDPVLLTSACLAAYFYLRALGDRERVWLWVVAGMTSGVLSLARPEGILYAGFIALWIMAHRPPSKQLALYALCLGLFVVPMVIIWWVNFGFLWPENYNRTLGLSFPAQNYEILKARDALGFYQRGLGLDGLSAVTFLALFLSSVMAGTIMMAFKDRRLLAFVLPGIGNTVTIFFANPWIPNSFHFADFFRHASFGIPFLVVASAYCFHLAYRWMMQRGRFKVAAYACLLILVGIVAREGDILANPTATHRPGDPVPTQVLTTYTYLSMQSILEHTLPLPAMTYRRIDEVVLPHLPSMAWPEEAIEFFRPLDMAFDAWARPFGYGSLIAFLVCLGFALLAERVATTARVSDASNTSSRFGRCRPSLASTASLESGESVI